MTIRNTAADDPLYTLLATAQPGGIEAQEAAGQRQLAASSQLPAEGIAALVPLGVEVRGPSKGDDLFVDVTLPTGWSIRPTDHSMWSELVNEAGEVVASIFYKAAFYDRRASISLRKQS